MVIYDSYLMWVAQNDIETHKTQKVNVGLSCIKIYMITSHTSYYLSM